MHAFDRQTDGRTDNRQTAFSLLDRVCIACSAVKSNNVHITQIEFRAGESIERIYADDSDQSLHCLINLLTSLNFITLVDELLGR